MPTLTYIPNLLEDYADCHYDMIAEQSKYIVSQVICKSKLFN